MREGFRRVLGPFDASMVVIGGIIGAGIFINPYIVAQRLDSAPLVLAAWAAGGAIAMAGAFTFSELGSLFPHAGGHYAYLRDAYHPMAGFLYGWALLLMIESGAIAAVGITFSEYTLRMLGRPDVSSAPLTVAAIVLVAAVNYAGVKPGSRVLNVFVVLKVLALLVLIAAGLLLPVEQMADGAAALSDTLDAPGSPEGTAGQSPGRGTASILSLLGLPLAFGAALIPVMFSYGGWQNANYVAEEVREPRKNLPRAIVGGTLVVVVVYVLVNWAYLRTLGHEGLASTLTPAADTAGVLFGPVGDRLVAAGIAISTFGFLNLTMLAPTRVYWAMASDRVFFPAVARLHPRFRTPSLAIVLQSVWAILLVLTGTYAQLVDYVVFADWVFFALAAASLFVFRRRVPLDERPDGTYATPGYPWLPGLFLLAGFVLVGSTLWANPVRSGVSVLLLCTGVPAYLFWRSRLGAESAGPPPGPEPDPGPEAQAPGRRDDE